MRKMGILPIEKHSFQFTRNWFLNRNSATFREFIHPEWSGKPIRYLELGVFEGMSIVWMMQHILTHKDSFSVGIDPWLITSKLSGEVMEEVMKRAFHNTKPFPNCTLIRGNSVEVLMRMNKYRHGFLGIKKNSVDLCMVDGNHNNLAVQDDAQRCHKLLRVGGWMLFDDVENDKPKEDHVKQGLNVFIEEYKDKMKLLWKHRYMECYEKIQ